MAIGAEPLRLGSGAGHDGQAMAKLCPIGMLFADSARRMLRVGAQRSIAARSEHFS